MDSIYEKKTAGLTAGIKDADTRKGIVTGYFSAFGNKDSDGDIIVKGAFTRTISKHGPDSTEPRIKHFLNHEIDKPLGKLLVLKEDNTGLYYESLVGKHRLGLDFLAMVDSGLITEHSIGYRRIKWEADPRDTSTTILTELHLWEGSSLTGFGANQYTPLTGSKIAGAAGGLAEIELLLKRHAAIDNFCRNSEASDETIECLLIHTKQLAQMIVDAKKAKERGNQGLMDELLAELKKVPTMFN